MPQRAATDRVGSHIITHAAVGRGAFGLFDCFLRFLHGQGRGPAETFGRFGGVVRGPVVIGPATGRQQFGVTELATEHLAGIGRVENLDIHALLVHVHEAACGAKAGFFGAFKAVHGLIGSLEKRFGRHRVFALFTGKRLAFDQKGAASRPRCLAHPGRFGLIGVLHMPFPQPVRLHHMRIGINNFESVTHGQFPPLRAAFLSPFGPLCGITSVAVGVGGHA